MQPYREPVKMSQQGSLTRKSKKDDVEALLSDFDILDKPTNIPAPSSRPVASGAVPAAATAAAIAKSSSGSSQIGDGNRLSSEHHGQDAQALLNDLDDLVKQRRTGLTASRKPSSTSLTGGRITPSTPQKVATPTPIPGDTLSVDAGTTATIAPASAAPSGAKAADQMAPTTNQAAGGWGGSWWSSATKLADQARAELEKRAAQVAETASGATDQSTGTREGVTTAARPAWQLASNINSFIKSHGGDLNKLRDDISSVGAKRWNEILAVVAPPIESHEVLSITLSHDMIGFEGVPDAVFQVLQRIMEAHASSQHADRQLIVNKAPDQTKDKDKPQAQQQDADSERSDLRPVLGFQEAWKLSDIRLEELIASYRSHEKSDKPVSNDSITLPVTTSPLFIRIQPLLDNLPGVSRGSVGLTQESATHLFLAILLRDPKNNLIHRTVSQPIPKAYASLTFEENAWAEELLSESLQAALSSVGVEYVRSRMQAQAQALQSAAAASASNADEEGKVAN